MNGDRMRCPECGEAAVGQPPADLTPWEAHGTPSPEWSHHDGSSLCPVIDPSGGYRPAEPHLAQPEPDSHAGRALATNAIAALSRERSIRVVARLGDLHRQALRAEPEPEAGA